MTGPNPELMHLYGTDAYYLEKIGALPLGLRMLGGAASMALFHADRKHQEELLAQAALMNRLMRRAEAARMQGVAAGFAGAGVPRQAPTSVEPLDIQYPHDPVMSEFEQAAEMERRASAELDPWLSKLASDIGAAMAVRASQDGQFDELMEKMAAGELTEMEKQALLGLLRQGAGAAKKFFSGAGQKVLGAFKKPGVGAPKVPGVAKVTTPPKPAGIAGGAYRTPAKTVMQGPAPMGKVTPGATQRGFVSGNPPGATQSPWASKAPARNTAGPSGPAELAGAQTAAQKNVARGSEKMLAKADPTPAAAPAPTPKKPWLSGATKAKIGLGVAGAGLAYTGYKGLQAARDYMMVPSYGGGQYGAYGPRPASQVNQYGYAPVQY